MRCQTCFAWGYFGFLQIDFGSSVRGWAGHAAVGGQSRVLSVSACGQVVQFCRRRHGVGLGWGEVLCHRFTGHVGGAGLSL